MTRPTNAQIAVRSRARADQAHAAMRTRYREMGAAGRTALSEELIRRAEHAATHIDLDISSLALIGAELVLASLAEEDS